MKKYKVCVYAISKNESKFVARWVNSMKEADEIYVLDTGSSDDTVKLLKERNVKVEIKNYEIWRFDQARNDSLSLVADDTDICVCTDIDEVFTKGWRKKLEKVWDDETNIVKYKINVGFDKNGIPSTTFFISKIHTKKDFKWIYPVHEVLTYIGKDKEKLKICEDFELNHYPDDTKSRKNYLNLLKLAVKENPQDDRCMHYLGREYMYKRKWNKAIDTLIKHLSLESAWWKCERSASMRYIGKCYIELKRFEEARLWFSKAIIENPTMREAFYDLAFLEYTLKKYDIAKKYLECALKIKEKSKEYFNESVCWNGSIEDIMSICEYNLGNIEDALKYAKEALEMQPDNERIKNNINFMESMK